MLKKSIFILLLFLFFRGVAQNTKDTVAPWKLMYLSGELNLQSFYREQQWTLSSGYQEKDKSNGAYGGIILNTKSFIWHPNFLQLDMGLAYSPGRYRDNYLLTQDISDLNTTKKLNLKATFFNDKDITISSFLRLSETYQNRENLTNIKTKNSSVGASLRLKNKFFPLWLKYEDSKLDQIEIPIERSFINKKKSLRAKVVRSFFVLDRHELSYTHDEDEYEYIGDAQGTMRSLIKNTTNDVRLQSKVFFSPVKSSNINSLVNYRSQEGNIGFKSFRVQETGMFYLPYNLLSINTYEYSKFEQETQKTQQHRIETDLRHQLYKSLQTDVFFKYTNLTHTFYDQYTYRAGFALAYTKKIPTDGVFNLNYRYERYHEDMKSTTLLLNIFREEHTLLDAEIEMLDKPYIDLASIVVTDVTGTIIYQLNFDYILVEINNFIEIRRIPGGLIPNGGIVFVDYQATQLGTYNFDANNHSFSASVSLFKQILTLYYRRNQMDYVNTDQIDFLTLNYFTENIVGSKVKVFFGEAGVEYNSYKSTIVPYQMMRYYIQLQHNINNKALLALQGNMRDYKMINNLVDQRYIDISSRFVYSFKPQTKLSLDLGYRNQIGETIDLKLLTARLEFRTLLRQLYLTAGIEAFRRDYLTQQISLNGAYVRITRKF